jgi:predicted nucleotidyltransferase
MSKDKVLSEIRDVANTEIPRGAKVFLYGSRARGDAHEDSDWDVLVLVDKDSLPAPEYELYSYPFWELGWKIDAMIHPTVYTENDWKTKSSPIFRENVERESLRLC